MRFIKVMDKKEEHTNNKTYELHLALTLDSGHHRHIVHRHQQKYTRICDQNV
jgi:hypothetical protein